MNWNLLLLEQFIAFFGEYFLWAGGAFLLLYVLLPRVLRSRKIQQVMPGSPEIRREILYSSQTLTIFALTGFGVFVATAHGWTRLYFDIEPRGWPYFWFSLLLLIVLHDTWFYWTHRFMHWKRVYRLVHHPHHRSHHPTPWAAFAFHPLEALIQVAVYPIIIVIVPINAWAGTLWLLYVTLFNVFLHLGFELLPAGFVRHWFFRWHNTSVHHDMHHSHSNSNFGLYFNIWDHLMGTLHENYEATFEKVTRPGKKKPRKKSAALFKTRAA